MTLEEVQNIATKSTVFLQSRGYKKGYWRKKGYKKEKVNGKLGFYVSLLDVKITCSTKIEVQCPSCGKLRKVSINSLTASKSPYCLPCTNKINYTKDVVGMKFGRWEVQVDTGEKDKFGNAFLLCKCECGTTRKVNKHSLALGRSLSCGCLHREVSSKVMTEYNRRKGCRVREDYTAEENFEYDCNIRERFYQSCQWLALRKGVLKDQVTCQKCGSNTNLRVHHIYSRYIFRSFQLNKEWLITLCASCHMNFHNSLTPNISHPYLFEQWLKVS